MKIIVEMTDSELSDALTRYLESKNLAYKSHVFVDDNVLQISADTLPPRELRDVAVTLRLAQTGGPSAAPAVPQPVVAEDNPPMSLTALRTTPPVIAVEDSHTQPPVRSEEEDAQLVRDLVKELGELPEAPVKGPQHG